MAGQNRGLCPHWSDTLREVGVVLLGFTSQVLISACGSVAVDQADPVRPTQSSEVDDDDDQVVEPAEVTTDKTLWFEATPVFCCNPLSLDFVVDLTEAPAGVSAPFEWDFDDGRTATGAAVQHTFAVPGDYLVTLTAAVPGGSAVKAERIISLTGQSTGDPESPDDSTDDGDGADDILDPDEDVTPPVADAGVDQTVAPAEMVQLDGSDSFAESSAPLAFLWLQTAGPNVTLSDVDSVAPTFIAPSAYSAPVTLVFQMLAAAAGLSDSDTVTVTVVPQDVEPNLSFPPGVRVAFLSGPSGMSAPGLAEVSWTFVGDVRVSNVSLTQDCCQCEDVAGAILTPDADGVYHWAVTVPADGTIFYFVRYSLGGVDYQSQSIYVNPPVGDPNAASAPVIWYHGGAIDPNILHDVIRSGVVTHVMIGGADRVAHRFDHPRILEAIEICHDAGLTVIWGRHLWNNWEDFQTLEDALDPDFYVSAIAQIRAEADALGVELTAMDCEVYGQAPLNDYFDQDLSTDVFGAMQAAILQAAALGQVDFVHPAGTTRRPLHHYNLYGELGRLRVAQGTYLDAPAKICKIDYEYDVFAAYVQPTTENPERGLFPFRLAHNIVQRRYLWSQTDGAPPMVNGLWLYPGATAVHEDAVREAAVMLADFFDDP